MELTGRQKLLLGIVGSLSYVSGRTRMQKYMLFVEKDILKRPIYGDWRADKYGAFSVGLMCDMQALQEQSLLAAYTVGGFDRFAPSPQAAKMMQEFSGKIHDDLHVVRQSLLAYQKLSLDDLLVYSHTAHPEYTSNSTIRPKVNKRSGQMAEFDTNPSPHNARLPPPQECRFGDEDIRLELAKSIGYDHILPIDPDGYSKFSGGGASILEDGEDFDAVECIRASRNS